MRAIRRKKRSLVAVLATVLVVAVWPSGSAFGVDQDALKEAQDALDARMEAWRQAGGRPKSRTEQLQVRIEQSRRAWERQQDREKQRAIFEAARAEVYLQMARFYASVGYVYRVYSPSLIEDRATGIVTEVYVSRSVLVMDPLAARLSAYFAEKAALGKAMAAAREYRANTFYRKCVENAQYRIAALQDQVKLEQQLAAKPQP